MNIDLSEGSERDPFGVAEKYDFLYYTGALSIAL